LSIHLTCLIIRLIIQTIRRGPTGSVQTDESSNVSRPDPSGGDQSDAQHQATDAVLTLGIHAGRSLLATLVWALVT
jgi:hypothetical protein